MHFCLLLCLGFACRSRKLKDVTWGISGQVYFNLKTISCSKAIFIRLKIAKIYAEKTRWEKVSTADNEKILSPAQKCQRFANNCCITICRHFKKGSLCVQRGWKICIAQELYSTKCVFFQLDRKNPSFRKVLK